MHVAVDVDALNGDAVLAAVEEPAEGDAGGDGVDISIVVDDEGAVATQFEGDALEAGVGLDAPANLGAAGEGDDLEAFVAHQRLGLRAGHGQDGDGAVGETGFAGELGQAEGGERGLAGGLDDDAVAGGEGGAELVGGQQQREVERGDTQDRADGEALHPAGAVHAGGDGIQGQDFAGDTEGFLGGAVQGGDGAVDFAVGLAAQLAGFVNVFGDQALAVGFDQVGQAVQQLGSGDVVEGVDSQLDGLLGNLGSGPVDDRGDRVVVGAADFEQVAGLDGPAAQDQRALNRWSGGCDGHQ